MCIRDSEKRLHLLECARQQDETDEDGRALLEAVERFELAKKKGESLEPERQRLGSLLKQYYQEALKSWEAKQEQNRKEQETVRETLKSKEERLEELQNQIIDYASRMAGQKTRIAVFDQRENRFNKMYGESLKRDVYKRQAHYAALIRAKSPTKCDAQLTKSNFQTRLTLCLISVSYTHLDDREDEPAGRPRPKQRTGKIIRRSTAGVIRCS